MIDPAGARFTGDGAIDALVVGAGPTGLTLAAQLQRFGIRFRVIDRLVDRGRESRALAIQARSLEIFQSLGIAEALVCRGRSTARLMIHVDTRFPFILFVSQAETEAVLVDYLRSAAVTLERGVELTTPRAAPQHVTCVLRHPDGRNEQVDASYVLGCDGAHSTVRKLAGGAGPS
jgi:2-polyprenyl-6-methoxyphenol hydroxylase-like FAD-dependent oxidoreductase